MDKHETIIVMGKIHEKALDYIQKFAEIIIVENLNQEYDDSIFYNADAILHKTGKIPADLIHRSRNLKIIARHGVGVNDIDLEATRKANIWVTTTPDANTNSVAEFAFTSILSMAKKFIESAKDYAKSREWHKREQFKGFDLVQSTLGIVGMGKIGRRVASIALSFNMKVLAYDPFVTPNTFMIGVEYVSLEALLAGSDFVSIHCPLNEQTRNLLNKERLTLMKETAYIINTARGGIIDEQALYEQLYNRKLAGAVLDVLEKEPPDQNHPLFELKQVVLTPHIAAMTQQAQEKMAMMAALEIERVLVKKENPLNFV